MIRLDESNHYYSSGHGLGAACAHLLVERGAQVVIHDAGVNKEGTSHDTFRTVVQFALYDRPPRSSSNSVGSTPLHWLAILIV